MANALRAILIIAASYGVAFASNVPLVYQLAYATTAIVFIGFFWSRQNVKTLEVLRQPTALRAQVGQTLKESFHVKNGSHLPNFCTEVVDHSSLPGHRLNLAFSLMPKGARSWELATTCRQRGKFTLGPYAVGTADPLGIFKWRSLVPQTWTVVVYPPTYDLPNFNLVAGELIGGQALRQRTFFVTPSAAGIRDYVPGDSLNRIHWPSTAKARRLMTKEFELDPASDIWIALDLQQSVQTGRGPESTIEYGVAIAASLAKHFLDQNRSVGIVAVGAHRMVIQSDRGSRQLLKVLEELAVVKAEGHLPFIEVLAAEGNRFGRNATLIAVSPSTDESWGKALEHIRHRRVNTMAIHLESSTFGEAPGSLLLISAFATANIPALVIKKGDNIGETLCLSD